jgi:hypothetical protein
MPKRKPIQEKDLLGNPDNILVAEAVQYLKYKTTEDKAKREKDKHKKVIMTLMHDESNHKVSSKGHLEAELSLGDGLNTVFIQVQKRHSVKMVDGILDLLTERLGEDVVEPYTITQKFLHPDALEQLFHKGHITAEEIEELTVDKETEALIIKANKKKK